MPNTTMPIAEPVIEGEVVADTSSIRGIIRIMQQDAIDYANQRDMIKSVMDFYDNTKDFLNSYKNENECHIVCEEEIDRWSNTVNDKYKNDKRGYIESKNKYEYIIQKLEQFNNEYSLDIEEDINNIKEAYDEKEGEHTCSCGNNIED